MPELRHGDAVAEQLTLVDAQLNQLLAGQAALAGQQTRVLHLLADAESVDPDRPYSRTNAARLLSVHLKTIDRWSRQGTLSAVHLGRRVYITGGSIRDHRHSTRNPAAEVLKL